MKIDSYKNGEYYPFSEYMPEWKLDVDWSDYLTNLGWEKICDSDVLKVKIWHYKDDYVNYERFLVDIDFGYDTKTIFVGSFSDLISLLAWLEPLWKLNLHKSNQGKE